MASTGRHGRGWGPWGAAAVLALAGAGALALARHADDATPDAHDGGADAADPGTDGPPPRRAGADLEAAPRLGADRPRDDVDRGGRVRLGARLVVEVVDAGDGRPLVGAGIEAEVELVDDPRGGSPHAVLATREAKTSADGRAVLERMPLERPITLRVRAKGHVRARVVLEASADRERAVRVALSPPLAPALASARLEVAVDGRALAPDEGVLSVLVEGADPREVRPGDAVFVDDDPAGAPTRQATVRLLRPGWAGPPVPVTLTRGAGVRVDATPPPSREVVVVAVDPSGAPLADVEVAIAPAEVLGTVEAHTTWRGVTDGAGVVRAVAPFASALAVRPRAPRRYFPVAARIVDLVAPSTRVEAVGLPLAPLTLVLAGGVPPSALAFAWSDLEFAPAVVGAAVGDDAGGARATALDALARALPAQGRPEAGAPPRVALAVPPGTFTLVVRGDGATSAPTSCVVPPEGAVVEVRLAALAAVPFTVVAADGGASFAGGVWIGHRAGFAERFAVERLLGRLWRGASAADGARWVAALVTASRGAPGGLPADAAAVGPDGRVDGRSDGVADEGTLMLPDGRVALVRPAPRPRDAGTTVRVGPAAFASVRVRLADADGRPRAGVPVVVNPLEAMVEGHRDLSSTFRTDADGVIVLGVVEGDALGLRPTVGTWVPAAADGASATLVLAEGRDPVVAVRVGAARVASVELRASGR